MGGWLAKSGAPFNLNHSHATPEVVMGSKLRLSQQTSRAAALVAVIGTILLMALTANLDAQEPSSSTRSTSSSQKHWDATAPGRVEASSQTIRIAAPVAGRIAEVVVKVN